MVIMLPKERTILSMLTFTLWTELWRTDLHKTYLNRYDRKWIEITRFCKQQCDPKIKERQILRKSSYYIAAEWA